MEIFPMIQPEIVEVETSLPMYKEIAWDYKINTPIYKNGSPVVIEGANAVLVWAWKALHVNRFEHEIYTWNYGNEMESLIGQSFTSELKISEATRYIRDTLLINPYIEDVEDIKVNFNEDRITIECKIITIYGEVDLYV